MTLETVPDTFFYSLTPFSILQTYMSFTPRPVRAGEQVEVNVDFSFDPDPTAVLQCVDLRLGVDGHELSYQIG